MDNALAHFHAVCLDANDPFTVGPFWAEVLDLAWEPDKEDGDGRLVGPTPQHTIWVNRVPEPKTVKNRVHLDIYATSLEGLEQLGSTLVLPEGDDRRWTVMADPEGGEFCAFLRSELPQDRLHGLVVDCADPAAIAQWWADAYGADVVHDERGFSTVEHVAGMPILTMDFVPVPEPKQGKNRVHWDVTTPDVAALVDAGATIVLPEGEDRRWTVLADPEGNEFCAFERG